MQSNVVPGRRKPRSRSTLAALLLGMPLAAALLALCSSDWLAQTPLRRYVSHPVEVAEVVLFCAALGALTSKWWSYLAERRACRLAAVPPWDGRKAPVSEAGALLARLEQLPRLYQGTRLVQRIAAVLDFLRRRGSADDLDEQLVHLADNDAQALENSYGLIRFITWAIPILGFLGTVLGITQAIAGVTPEVLEKSLNQVTDGLAVAFDTTAVALSLTMVLMLLTFVTERAEQGILETVDRTVAQELAHRFERSSPGGDEFVAAVRRSTDVLLQATERLVEQQAAVWAKALTAAEQRWAAAEQRQQQRLAAGLEAALAQALESHARRLAAVEERFVSQSAALVEQLAGLAAVVRQASQEQQAALASVAQQVAAQVESLTRLREGEQQLARAQETLTQNLAALANANLLEEAVHSLTAAAHLLTAKAGGGRVGRPGTAA